MEKGLVSIITITRNRGNLIGRCVTSVLNQTYKNIEHIVVDGASDDNTDEVLKEVATKDPRLKYIRLDSNWPLFDTIDYAVEQSRGEYITFLDSDDEYLPTKIEKQVKLIETLPADYGMVYCWMTYYDQATMKTIRLHQPKLRGMVPDDVVSEPILSGTPLYFFRREAYLENGGWNRELPVISDWEMACRFCQRWKVDFVPESLVNVYENHGFERQTEVILRQKKSYANRVAMHQYMLDEFAENFKRHPRRKCSHYSRMLYFSFKSGKYRDALKYSMIYIKTKIFG